MITEKPNSPRFVVMITKGFIYHLFVIMITRWIYDDSD